MAICPTCRNTFPDGVTVCPEHGEALLPPEAFSSADADLAKGYVVGEYVVENKLGEGGFGAVYRAVHPLIAKTVAVKVLSRQFSSNPQMVSRFISEARAVNQIRHRNIIDIFAFGALPDGRQYYVMELLEGVTLDKLIKDRGRIEPELAITLLRGIARALDAAHAQGIAHRDLKPENIFLVTDEDGGFFPKLLDFGIAKLLSDNAAGVKTRTGAPIGTPYYMSPEQCRGKDVDHRTDIYSFGIMVHEMLTGQLPFVGESVVDLLVKHTSAEPPTVSSVRPEVPAALDAPVLHMLQKDPAARPISLTAAVDGLAQAALSAGYSVKVPSRSSGQGFGVVSVRGPESALNSDPAFVDARTMATDTLGTKTLLGAETPVPEAPRKMWLAGAVVAALALGAVIFAFTRGPGAESPVPAATAQPAESASGVASAAPEPEVVPAPSASAAPAVEPAAPNVEVTIEATPPQAEVFEGDKKLGVAPGPFSLPRGTDKIELTVKAAGYVTAKVGVTPSANAVVSVNLQKIAVPKQKGPGPSSGELENPFGN